MIDNYPPLSFYLVGALGRVLGDYIFAGRIISLLSFFFVSFGIFAAARRMGCKHFGGIVRGALYAGGLLVFTDYVGMDDPSDAGARHCDGGFAAAVDEPRGMARVAAAALLFVLAVFVKHM